MEAMAPYIIACLLGMATPIFFFRQLMRHLAPDSPEEGCFFDLLLLPILLLIGVVLYAWLRAVLSG